MIQLKSCSHSCACESSLHDHHLFYNPQNISHLYLQIVFPMASQRGQRMSLPYVLVAQHP